MSAPSSYSYDSLHDFYQSRRLEFTSHFDSRLRRALSWLHRAERETDDPHVAFILYWISFNAGYSPSFEDISKKERQRTARYFNLLVKCDASNSIHDIIWQRQNAQVKRLLNNKYIYPGFWQRPDPHTDQSWKAEFQRQKRNIKRALNTENTVTAVNILFSRLFLLRNQLFHGSATWNGERNLPQVRAACKIIAKLQPVFLSVMLKNPQEDWGRVSYDLYAEGKESWDGIKSRL